MTQQINFSYINWGPYVHQTNVGLEIVERLLKDGDIVRKKGTTNLHNNHLAGQLKEQYFYDKPTLEWFYEEMSGHWQCYRKGHEDFHRMLDVSPKGEKAPNVQMAATNLWVNYMKAGEFNPPHMHTGDLSFVLFLTAPEEIKIEAEQFEGTSSKPGDVVFMYGEHSHPKWSTNHCNHSPKVGDIIIFPATVSHWVCPFYSEDVERVSVSGNLSYLEREKWPSDYF
ncbi:2OG-Fe(II) oxygenase family protein [bacterium]|nr:2OG-Fe(II) oxygenase family protein [bacterium]